MDVHLLYNCHCEEERTRELYSYERVNIGCEVEGGKHVPFHEHIQAKRSDARG